ncbi:TetR/AcrR family transcriptional regulator [Labedella endophytica]|jgi:AcrR family transcriptional regulator|uniref:TetR/AcrR family transcriptional regulator n=1 Tax=Labedella endophytica TaxID=1523160 RepID=A0A3S0VUF2_9MICO|nr:TetR/AcrR family transcriptional regulator [Labedella endophytica]RUR01765.1 TetR/AcrR family transcriptional regulator [Labedella endophytica]
MTSQPRGPYKTGIESRRRLVENAILVFGEHGYRGGSLRMIAEAVGASASQIINLFGSKHELLTAVLDRWDEQQVGEEAREGLAYVDTLRERIRYSRDNPTWVEFFLTLGSEATGQGHPAHDYFVERYDHITNRLQEEILHAAASGEIAPMEAASARAEAQQLSAMMDGLQLQWLLDPSVDLVGTFDRYLDVVVERWRTGTAPASA